MSYISLYPSKKGINVIGGAGKLFNYFIQLIETERNMEMLCEMPDDFLSRIMLYVYDSILIDAPSTDIFTNAVLVTITNNGAFKIASKTGPNYYLMTSNTIYHHGQLI